MRTGVFLESHRGRPVSIKEQTQRRARGDQRSAGTTRKSALALFLVLLVVAQRPTSAAPPVGLSSVVAAATAAAATSATFANAVTVALPNDAPVDYSEHHKSNQLVSENQCRQGLQLAQKGKPLDLTVGYLTAIKGGLKDRQGLAISGALTMALDEVTILFFLQFYLY